MLFLSGAEREVGFSGGLLLVGFDDFEVGTTDELFLQCGGVLEDDDVDIVEGGELLLDGPDKVLALNADPLSRFEVHGARLGSRWPGSLSQEGGKPGGQNSNREPARR